MGIVVSLLTPIQPNQKVMNNLNHRGPQFSVRMATFVLAGANPGIGSYIASAGGHVRHKEFRFEPPPPPTRRTSS
jgi:hypothetical protein